MINKIKTTILIAIVSSGCSVQKLIPVKTVAKPEIYEIASRMHTGIMGVGTNVVFNANGESTLTCSYAAHVLSNDPGFDKGLCMTLLRSNPGKIDAGQSRITDDLKITSTGRIDQKNFEFLQQLIVASDFFSMSDNTSNSDRTDSPPVITTVRFANGDKSVINHEPNVGNKLNEIEAAIFSAANSIAWVRQ